MNESDGNSNLGHSKVIIHVISGLTNYIFLLLLNLYIKSTFCDKVSFKVKSKSEEDPYIYTCKNVANIIHYSFIILIF